MADLFDKEKETNKLTRALHYRYLDIMRGRTLKPSYGGLYGNWGGPGYGKGPPVSAIDRVFRDHDRMYPKNADLANHQLVQGLRSITPEGVVDTFFKNAALLVLGGGE